MPLSDIAIRALKPRDRDFKVADGGGLNLLVKVNGSRLWQLSYRFGGQQKKLSIGPYPKVGLADARSQREDAKGLLRGGADPGVKKRLDKLVVVESAANTFDVIADSWLARIEAEGKHWRTVKKQKWLLQQARPWIGGRPITDIMPPEMYAVLKRIEKSGRLETARAVRTSCSSVFRHAIVTARGEQDPCIPLAGATLAPTVTHHAAIVEPKAIAKLLVAIRSYDGDPSTRSALRLLPLTFVRSSELRHAHWSEFNLDGGLWMIPAARMKGRLKNEHIVPLARQAVELLRELWDARLSDELLFPGLRSIRRPISENTINAALRRMGYSKAQMTGHGFRSTASTILNEMNFNSDWIERQLAHVEKNKVRGAYNAAQWLPERKIMMQRWADYLEGLELIG